MTSEKLPEQRFFADPALDRAVAMIMTLAAELFVTKDRLRSLEVLLERAAVLPHAALDGYVPDPAERERLTAEREAYVATLLNCVRGEAASKGLTAEQLQGFVGA